MAKFSEGGEPIDYAGAAYLFNPTTAHYEGTNSRNPRSKAPELGLIAAVLEMVVDDIEKRWNSTNLQSLMLAVSAMRWIHDEDHPDWPYRFTSVCDILGIEPEIARKLALRGRDPDDLERRFRRMLLRPCYRHLLSGKTGRGNRTRGADRARRYRKGKIECALS